MTQKIGTNKRPGLRPFKKGEGGRPPGVPNKLTRTAKENIDAVYAGLGGVEGHIAYLKAHGMALADFYAHVYPQLIPRDVSVSNPAGNGALRIEVVHTKGADAGGGNGGGNGGPEK